MWFHHLLSYLWELISTRVSFLYNCEILSFFGFYFFFPQLLDEDLIKWGWPEDVWFHVDNVSSAHVYLRLQKNQTLDDIHQDVLIDACQLV